LLVFEIFYYDLGNYLWISPTLLADYEMKDEFSREFHEFWSQTAGRVRAFMFCTCENWTDADDMTQDCFLRALRAWGQYRAEASRKAWLWGIAKRTRADWFRRKQRQAAIVTEDVEALIKEVPNERKNDKIDLVWDAIKKLSREKMDVIHLKFTAGLSYAQIAEALGIPVGTVRSRLHRGLNEVKILIGEKENEA
jgi:RNA polymerase sigma-70 factor (ECF subfamily)